MVFCGVAINFPIAMIIQLTDPLIPPNLTGPVLSDQHGLPRYWACVWSAAISGDLAETTHLKKLRHIGNLYEHSDQLYGHGALDNAIGTLDDQ